MIKENRSYNFEVRAENSEKHGNFITGRPIVFNSRTDIGDFDEIISPEALSNADTLRDVCFLVNHDLNKLPLARSRRNNENSTMQMSVTPDGLDIRVDLDTENNSESKNLYSAVSRGDISGMSFMFSVDEDSWDWTDESHPTRTITKIGRVWEVSAVSFPAYADTSISARSSSKEALENARKLLEEERAKKIEAENFAETLKKEEEERANILALLNTDNNFLK